MENKKIKLGIIGGSGVYEIEGMQDLREVNIETPYGDPSDAITIGNLDGVDIAFLPRHGKGHRISPADINVRANIWALKKLGVEVAISVSAVGSLRGDLPPGELLLADQFIDRTRCRESTFFETGLVGHVGFANPVCSSLAELINNACKAEGVKAQLGGTYVCMNGPQFSSLAESNLYRSWNADVIGMTALPEAKLAREAEICYSIMAMVTDFDCWHPDHDAVSVEMVVKQAVENAINAKKVLKRVIPELVKHAEENCTCKEALSGAIQTAPEAIDPAIKEKLKLIVGKYLK